MPFTPNKKMTAICLGFAFLVAACHKGASTTADDVAIFSVLEGQYIVPENSPLRTHLVMQAIAKAQSGRSVILPATVEADPARMVNVLTPLTGKITALKVGLGDSVKAGQVLAVLDSGDLAAAYADEDKARDVADAAQRAAERAAGVREAGAAADKDLETAESVLHQAQAELTRARSRLRILGGQSGDRRRELLLTAPVAGVVTVLNVARGANVNDPTATLMSIANLDEVFVTANVAEADVAAVTAGSAAEITLTAYPGRVFKGTVSSVNASLEPDTRRLKVRIRLPNADGALKPNMFASVKVSVPGDSGIAVPQSALLMNNDSTSVLVETKPWTFERRQVRLGDDAADCVYVLSGLKSGDRVVVKGGVLLND